MNSRAFLSGGVRRFVLSGIQALLQFIDTMIY